MRNRRTLLLLLIVLSTGYFGFHAVYGSRGLLAWHQLSQRRGQLMEELTSKKAALAALENRVQLLRPQRIDPDLLDERARAMLGFTAADESVVMEKGGGN
jgi:cell division protein FtsB